MGFAAYPGARDLCEQWTLASGSPAGELHWRSFVTKDDIVRVADFYTRRDSTPAEKSADGSLTLRHDKEIILSIDRAFPPNYPKCDQEAHPGENTVIIVSQFLPSSK